MTFVDIQCHCGKNFGLPNSKRKQILVDFDKFCGAECLRDFIKSLPISTKNIYNHGDVRSCDLGVPFDYWCPITKCNYRSSYEAIFAIFCVVIKEPYEYEPCSLLVGGNKKYHPDFYLPKRNLFVEVKGRWAGSNKSKMRTCVHRGHNLILVPDYLIRSINVYLSRINI